MAQSRQTSSRGRGSKKPLIFISHRSRDEHLAQALITLFNGVSGGRFDTFCSSKPGHIESSKDWLKTILARLRRSSDVVCLLTPNSVGGQWVLFEAGYATGRKPAAPVHVVALGMSLDEAIKDSPLASHQGTNGDDCEAMEKLVEALLKRLPGAKPEAETIRQQVKSFMRTVAEEPPKPASAEHPTPGAMFDALCLLHNGKGGERHGDVLRVKHAHSLEFWRNALFNSTSWQALSSAPDPWAGGEKRHALACEQLHQMRGGNSLQRVFVDPTKTNAVKTLIEKQRRFRGADIRTITRKKLAEALAGYKASDQHTQIDELARDLDFAVIDGSLLARFHLNKDGQLDHSTLTRKPEDVNAARLIFDVAARPPRSPSGRRSTPTVDASASPGAVSRRRARQLRELHGG